MLAVPWWPGRSDLINLYFSLQSFSTCLSCRASVFSCIFLLVILQILPLAKQTAWDRIADAAYDVAAWDRVVHAAYDAAADVAKISGWISPNW